MGRHAPVICLTLLVALAVPGCWGPPSSAPAPTDDAVRRSFFLMDTLVEMAAYGDTSTTTDAVEAAVGEMRRLEAIFDRHAPASFAAVFDRRAGRGPTTAPVEFIALLRASADLVNASEGAFDPTVAPLLDAYRFGEDEPRIPDDGEIGSLLSRCRWSAVVDTGDGTVGPSLRTSGAALDLGGVAKGYVVDRALDVLRRGGCSAALVNAGGDLRAFGRKPGGAPFRIGIQDPDDQQAIRGVLQVRDRAVATSGDYERYFERDGLRWHHLLDPTTGRPGRLSRSSTVVASSTMVADALATAVFVLGPRRGVALAERLPDVEAAVIAPDGTWSATSGFAGLLEDETGEP